MNRNVIAGISMLAAVILAAPSFATGSQQKVTQTPASAKATLRVATGEVLVSTPDYLVLVTRSGMKRFEITPESKILGGCAEGDEVTIQYKVVEVPGGATVAANGTRVRGSHAPGKNVTVAASHSSHAPAN